MGSSNSSSASGANKAGGFKEARGECSHSRTRYKVISISLWKCPVGIFAFTHWFVEVKVRCEECGATYVFTFDFGTEGSEYRLGEYTRGCRKIDGCPGYILS